LLTKKMTPKQKEEAAATTNGVLETGDVDIINGEPPMQFMYIVRHGDRWDYENPSWVGTTDRPGDPPLSPLGEQQARESGTFLETLMAQDGITNSSDITWLSSPFLRCLQTSNEMINMMGSKIESAKTDIAILPEYSVFEWDGKGGEWHASLPPLEERIHYFPRLNIQHKSMFVPEIPEPRSLFHDRCDRAIQSLERRYPVPSSLPRKRSALVIITHAAGCIGLARAATIGPIVLPENHSTSMSDNSQWKFLSHITPAAPCSVYRLTRTASTPPATWSLDPHDAPHSLNGHTDHLSNFASCNTVPWNHFGNKSYNKGYTGPPTSRFAPKPVATSSSSASDGESCK
jgi:broad specificity phosphatase PhoE